MHMNLTKHNPNSKSNYLWGVVLSAPSFLLVLIFFIYPFVMSFVRSFQTKDGSISSLNYVMAFERYGIDLLYTVFISASSLIILIVVTALIAGVFRLYAFPVLEFIFKIPLFVPYVVVGHAIRVYLAPHGTLNSLIAATGIINPDNLPSIAYSSIGLIFALVWKNLGLSLLLVLGAFRGINESMLEAAIEMGASKFKLIKDFLVPMSRGSFGVIAILTFTSMISSFSIPAMLGSGTYRMLMIDVHQQMIYQQNQGMANAIGVFGYLCSMGAAVYYLKGLNKK